MINLFKNYKTKKQLREEIKRLEGFLAMSPFENEHVISYGRKRVEVLRASVMMEKFYADAPEEMVKNEIAWKLLDEIKPFIEYGVRNESNGLHTYTGTIHVVGKDI